MKAKQNARERREAGKISWGSKAAEKKEQPAAAAKPAAGITPPSVPAAGKNSPLTAEERTRIEEEETRQFLEHIGRPDLKIVKDDTAGTGKAARKASPRIVVVNLEEGMPTAEQAVAEMRLALQREKHGGARAVKLIHGYGSSGRGGKIRTGVREELAAMKKKKLIRDYIPGEDFGPFGAAARELVDRDKGIARDPDYGKCNQGITVVAI